MSFPFLHGTPAGVVLALHVQPRASRNEICAIQGEELKVRLTSPPVEGAANRLCCEYLAKLLGVPKGQVTLVSGEKSQHKRILVAGLELAQAEKVLGCVLGKTAG